MGSGFDRFELTDDDRLIPNSWFPAAAELLGVTEEEVTRAWNAADRSAALKALARVSVDEAATKIGAAVAEAPLPDPPWLAPWIEYWKTHPTPVPVGTSTTPAPDASPVPTTDRPTSVPDATYTAPTPTPTKAP